MRTREEIQQQNFEDATKEAIKALQHESDKWKAEQEKKRAQAK